MLELIFATMVLYVVQLMLPNSLAQMRKDAALSYYLGNRDTDVTVSELPGRAQRAVRNLQESLFLFLPLAVLAVSSGASATEAAAVWFGLRIAYLISYLMGLAYVRTAIWMSSLVCLCLMAAAL